MTALTRYPWHAALLVAWLWTALLLAQPATAAVDFLPVDDAFAVAVERVDTDHVALSWQIADNYYLYRHTFDFTLVDSDGATAGSPRIPTGDKHTDEFFGPVETYRDTVRAVVPITGKAPLPDTARIKVSYQGCADAGLCYPPQTRTLVIPAAKANTPASTPANGSGASPASRQSSAEGFVAQQDALAKRLAEAGGFSTLLLFFGLGLLLAFTPCILPMIPILSGLIVGSGATTGRALVLSLAYVIAMSAAYAVFGVIAGYFGANIQAAMQMPAVLFSFGGVFVLLALASFGLFELQIPSAWQARIGAIGTRRGGVAGAGLMGFFAALIVGPCLAPPLVGALLYISSSGDAALGGGALFLLGLGMGVPLIAIGTFGARFMPRTGPWMRQVRVFFGVLLLGVALWLVSRVLDAQTALAGWGLLALGYGAYLSAHTATGVGALACKRAAVFLLFLYAGCAGVGVLAGQGRIDRPLAGLTATAPAQAGTRDRASVFTRVDNREQLEAALASAAKAGRPAMVDFYADWCVECVEMEHTVFADPQVRAALEPVAALQIDVTDYDRDDRALMQSLEVFGPPTMLFYRADGSEAAGRRLVGAVDASDFTRHLQQAVEPDSANTP